jgi:Flp pilus assembly protein TadD
LGIALANDGQVEEALRVCRRAIERSPDSGPSHDALAYALLSAGQFEAAAAEWAKAKQLMPLSPTPDCGIARVLIAQQRLPEAAAILQQVLQQWPDLYYAQELLANVQAALQGSPLPNP